MRHFRGFLWPVFFAGWICSAIGAIWQTQARSNDSALALTAATLLVASLAVSRYVLKLPFTAAPMMYLSLLGLFHLGLVVPWALGLYDIERIPWFVPRGLSEGLALIIYSILAFQLGLLAALGKEGYWKKSNITAFSNEDYTVFIAGNVLFLVGTIMFSIGLIHLDPVGYYRLTYSETFRLRAESDPRFFGTGIMISFIGLCMAVAGATRNQLRFVFVCAGFSFLTLFYLGFRGPALIAVLIVYAVAHKKGIRSPRWLPWTAAAILMVAIPVASVIREEPLNRRGFAASLHQISLLDGPAELGSALRPLVETTALIGPGNYRYGSTYLVAIKGILPNIALRWEAPDSESTDDLPPNHWITAVVDPWTHRNYGGIGFSGVAEPYMNFGVPGVGIYFLFLAFLLVRLEQVSIRSSYALAAWALIVGPLIVSSIRNDFSNVLRPVVWGLICLALVRAIGSLVGRASGRALHSNILEEERA